MPKAQKEVAFCGVLGELFNKLGMDLMLRNKLIIFTAIISMFLSLSIQAQRPKVYSREKPIKIDFDMENIKQPKSIGTGYLYDFIDGTIFQSTRRNLDVAHKFRKVSGKKKESINVNILDQVPDSSWFTNRISTQDFSIEEIKRGSNVNPKPKSGKLIVLRGKTVGATPGFWVRDENGQTFILKFDPKDFPELASGAEMIATKMFWAFGFNVPENHIFHFRREDLEISEEAQVTGEKNKKRGMTEADLDLILSKIARQSDGQYRSLASRLIDGSPLGGITFSGRRKDDPNDIIPHEIRRDVRALKVFGAWTEHNDLRVGNTFDVFVEEDGRKFVRHYLIDFGSTFGSDSVQVNLPEVGREHGLDFNQAGKILLSGGLYQPPWRSKKHDPVFSPAVGRYSTKNFSPNKWKQNFPLVALGQMTDLDGFWAMQKVAAFTPEQIRAIVETAEYSKESDTEYLTRQILARQRIIVQHYANELMGIGKFNLKREGDSSYLNFKDYRKQFSLDEIVNSQYEYKLQGLDKNAKTLAEGVFNDANLEINSDLVEQISAVGNAEKNRGIAKLILNRKGEGGKKATVYLWSKDGISLEIVGIVH